jgi:lysozyme
LGWLVSAFALLGALAALTWWVWLPSWRPELRSGEAHGLDVSNHQGEIDWQALADDGIDFAWIKASEGGDFVDAFFADNWQGAADADVRRGAYHFFTLCRPGAEQAANFLAVVPREGTMLAPSIDLELAGNCSQRPPQAWLEAELGEFIELVEEATGQQVLLYVGADIERVYDIKAVFDRPLWERRILRRPGGSWLVWQASYFADVNGVNGGVDLNVAPESYLVERPWPAAS